jgi:hypothetical protein
VARRSVEDLIAELLAEEDDEVGGSWHPRKPAADYSQEDSEPGPLPFDPEQGDPEPELNCRCVVPDAAPDLPTQTWPNKVRTCEACGTALREGKGRPPKLCAACAPQRMRQQRTYARSYYERNLRRRLEKRRERAEKRALMLSTWLAQLPER